MGKKKAKAKAKAAAAAPKIEEEEEEEYETKNDNETSEVIEEDEEEAEEKKVQKESKGQMKKRHLKEQKDLKLKISQMQHKVPKSDKAKRDELAKEIKAMTEALEARQKQELLDFDAREAGEEQAKVSEAAALEAQRKEVFNAQKQVKMQQKMEKQTELEKAEKERLEKLIAEAGPSDQAIEREKIEKKLHGRGLALLDVPADGDCLFHALADQLKRAGGSNAGKTDGEIRSEVVEYIRGHPDEYAGFVDSDKKEKDADQGAKMAAYCDKMSRKGCWGGDIEINAAANVYGCSITVISADASDIVIGSGNVNLTIAYLKHDLCTGEHYNSVIKNN